MRLYTLRRAWTSLLVVGVPLSFLALAWAAFMGGRASVAELAFAYLVIVACGRAQAIKQERNERPHRERRVAHQLARIRSTLPGADQAAPIVVEPIVVERVERPAEELESLRLRAV
jgi:hypothetical protein